MALFAIGDAVWYKKAGSTPFVTGDSGNAATVVGSELGGRGKHTVTFTNSTLGLGSAQGVPQFSPTTKTLLDAVSGEGTSTDLVDNTFPSSGLTIGVQERITSNHPLAPKTVTAQGPFDSPTPKSLVESNNNFDDEAGTEFTNIRTLNPDLPYGRNAKAAGSATASDKVGSAIPIAGTHEFVSEKIDISYPDGVSVGIRPPSSQEGAGVVVEIVTPSILKGEGVVQKSPDGTKIGSKSMYFVNWGPSAVSNPHRVKWNNRMRVTLHAEDDLIAI